MNRICAKLTSVSTVFAVVLTVSAANTFRVTPYVQHPKPDAMTVMWLADSGGDATLEYWKADAPSSVMTLNATSRADLSDIVTGIRFTNLNALEYCQAKELAYDLSPESGDRVSGKTAGYQYRARLTGLQPDTVYGYRVTLSGGSTYANSFRTSPSPDGWHSFKFIYYSDSETESSDRDAKGGRTSDWTMPGTTDVNQKRTYYACQTEAYASNICAAVDFGTDLIVMAGDLAQKGSRQQDWDEFWRHNAGDINDPAGSIPILASPGNHDYWSYHDGGECGVKKYMSYFEYEPNGASGIGDDQRERFHRVDYGPVTFIFLDANNGDDSGSDYTHDTNHFISRENDGYRRDRSYGSGCRAPDFNPGTPQYNWLESQLKDAQKKSAFTFIVTHQCPFSVGYHGRPNDTNTANDYEWLSGRPLRVLLPLLHKYGVDGWFAGHDEMMERSVHAGTETLPDGTEVSHSFNIWDMGIAGDGLRGTKLWDNPNQAYRADVDSPEIYENGILVEGGKHYGHLQVTIDQAEDGSWRATFDPVYVFFNNDANGNAVYGGVRHYADKVVRISNRCKGMPPAPTPVTKSSVDYSHYMPTKMPQALVTTFWQGPLTRGFAWQTDTSVTETKLWLLKGEYDQDDADDFVKVTPIVGTSASVDGSLINCHRVHTGTLEAGATYSYRLGGNGYYAYGRFAVTQPGDEITILDMNDVQPKEAPLLYKAENSAAVALRTVGGADKIDILVNGGDFINLTDFKNANHFIYGQDSDFKSKLNYLKWGMSAEAFQPYFPGVPTLFTPGTHDYMLYRNTVTIDYPTVLGLSTDDAGCQSVDYGPVHIATIPLMRQTDWNHNHAYLEAEVKWLEGDLKKAASAKWKIVCTHWGPYTTCDHGVDLAQDGADGFVRLITPVLSSGHVDLVLQAHDHTYSKTVPYRWDTAGYTGSASDGMVLNLNPETTSVGDETYDLNPQSTYYVSAGACGHRVGEDEKGYSKNTGDYSYTRRDPVIAIGTAAVASSYKKLGEYASGDFAKQMFGVLKIKGDTLAYDFYVAEEDGTATLVDKLRICKRAGGGKSGMSIILR